MYIYNTRNPISLHVSTVASEAYHDWSGATTCELYAKIIAESELLQPALNEIHKFCFQHWSRGRGTCGTGSGTPGLWYMYIYTSNLPGCAAVLVTAYLSMLCALDCKPHHWICRWWYCVGLSPLVGVWKEVPSGKSPCGEMLMAK